MSAIRWTVELASGRTIEVGPEGAHEILTSEKERHQGATLRADYEDAYAERFGQEVYTCEGTKADGDPCTREVDGSGEYCFQHAPEDS